VFNPKKPFEQRDLRGFCRRLFLGFQFPKIKSTATVVMEIIKKIWI